MYEIAPAGLGMNLSDYEAMRLTLNEFAANMKHYIRRDDDLAATIATNLLVKSFKYHFEANSFYRGFCRDMQVGGNDITKDNVLDIPSIPIQLFKDQNSHLLLSKKLSEIEFELRSTGTSGIPSVSRRDADTVDTLSLCFTSMYRDFFEISTGCGLFLCPSPAEVPEMGMVKAFNFLSGMLDDRTYIVRRYNFKAEEAVQILESWQDRFDRYIIGPPFMINRLFTYLQRNNIRMKLDKRSKLIMLGGWKRFTGEQISRAEFDELALEHLGMEKHQIRDMYGLVECNFLAIECEYGHKHVPPWVRIVVRDLKDPKRICKTGETGRISILDPTSFGYPCFIETEDIGRIEFDDRCDCGRSTQVMSFSRRIDGAELGCCAINMERFMEGAVIERTCEL